jgi:hypothetical protein
MSKNIILAEFLICSKKLLTEMCLYIRTNLTSDEKSTENLISYFNSQIFLHGLHRTSGSIIILYTFPMYCGTYTQDLPHLLRRPTYKTVFLRLLSAACYISATQSDPELDTITSHPFHCEYFYSPTHRKTTTKLTKLLTLTFTHSTQFNRSSKLSTPTQR